MFFRVTSRPVLFGLGLACSFAVVAAPTQAATKSTTKPTTKPTKTSTKTTENQATKSSKVTKSTNVKLEVEKRLSELQQKEAPNLAVGKATCPAEMAKIQSATKKAATKAQVFRCTVLVEGVAAPYDVEIRDSGFTNGGSFLMSRARAIIDITKVVEGTKLQLDEKDRASASVSCGASKVMIANVGDVIACTVAFSNGAASETVNYEVKDLDGTISLKL